MAILSLVVAALVGRAEAASSTVAHKGKWLIDAQGRVLNVHGLNVVNKLAPYTPQAIGFGEDDAAFLKTNGFNVVRLGVIWTGVEPQPGVYNAAYVAQIKETQQILARHNIYTLLDWHQDLYNEMFGGEGFPAWAADTGGLAPASPLIKFPDAYDNDPAQKAAWDNFLANKPGPGGIGLQDRLAAAERYVAMSFIGDPWLLGYDVINEPNEGNAAWPGHDQLLGAMQKKLMNAIRTVDADHMIFYEPIMLYGISGESLPDFNDAHAGMSYHAYCFEPGGTPELLYAVLCGGVLNGAMSNANAHSTRTGNANILSEFGSAEPYAIRMVADYADDNMTSWINWAYCGCGDPTTAIDVMKEGIVLDPKVAPTGSNIYTPSFNVLVRPYPQAVTGTPTSWKYNTTNRQFNFAYSTTSPAGVSASAGATTTIAVPALNYPTGYSVTVTGGRVEEGLGTTSLSIAANAGATSVTVVITPSTGSTTTTTRPATTTTLATTTTTRQVTTTTTTRPPSTTAPANFFKWFLCFFFRIGC